MIVQTVLLFMSCDTGRKENSHNSVLFQVIALTVALRELRQAHLSHHVDKYVRVL